MTVVDRVHNSLSELLKTVTGTTVQQGKQIDGQETDIKGRRVQLAKEHTDNISKETLVTEESVEVIKMLNDDTGNLFMNTINQFAQKAFHHPNHSWHTPARS